MSALLQQNYQASIYGISVGNIPSSIKLYKGSFIMETESSTAVESPDPSKYSIRISYIISAISSTVSLSFSQTTVHSFTFRALIYNMCSCYNRQTTTQALLALYPFHKNIQHNKSQIFSIVSPPIMDIGANLCSSMYAGIYKGKKIHTPDLEQVLRRARENGVEKIVVTIGSLKDLKFIGKLKEDPNIFFTIGIHPTNGQEFGPQAAKQIRQRFNNPKFVFYGEFGLDYDRLQLCPKEQQITAFKEQLVLAHESKLPLFLHCRNAADDFFKIINEAEHALKCKFRGVVHSFTGNLQELQMCTHHGFSVSLNGCGMKTQEQLNLIREIDIKQLMVETDCP